jgi:hypothetical protein
MLIDVASAAGRIGIHTIQFQNGLYVLSPVKMVCPYFDVLNFGRCVVFGTIVLLLAITVGAWRNGGFRRKNCHYTTKVKAR